MGVRGSCPAFPAKRASLWDMPCQPASTRTFGWGGPIIGAGLPHHADRSRARECPRPASPDTTLDNCAAVSRRADRPESRGWITGHVTSSACQRGPEDTVMAGGATNVHRTACEPTRRSAPTDYAADPELKAFGHGAPPSGVPLDLAAMGIRVPVRISEDFQSLGFV